MLQGGWLLATAIGLPLTDRLLVRDGDPTLAVWATGVLALVGAACALALHEPARPARSTAREIATRAWGDVVRRPDVLAIVVYSVGVFVLIRLAITCFFNPVLGQAGWPVDTWGSVLAAVNLVGGLAAWRGSEWSDRVGPRALLWAMPASLLIMYVGLAWADGRWVAAWFGVQGVMLGLQPTLVRALLNERVPSAERRATVLSFESLACRLGTGVVGGFVGWSLGAWSLDAALAAGAALGCLPFLALPWLWAASRREAQGARSSGR